MTLNFSKSLEAKKKNTKILILSAYSPLKKQKIEENQFEGRLANLKFSLQGKGFVLTRLVRDWIDETDVPEEQMEVHFRDKSFYYIKNWADILIFVFLEDCNNSSVEREWSYMIDKVFEKCNRSIIIRNEKIDLGCLIRGDIKSERVLEYKFSNDNELQDFAFNGCFNILYRLHRTQIQ